ncbi:MAG TPA: xanthine dehydrogenase family protein molybdopterin-binding subunit [Casimicrobiaceae bacterium]|nr:xanthine dehydrogenase family protein molybdopterin-binding subunit [Casimicrobiaceae bacterium]
MTGDGSVIGRPLDRTDGPLKVTGGARYAAEFRLPDLCHAVMVLSTIAHGQIVDLDVTRAERAPGVLLVLSHRNAPALPQGGRAAFNPPAGRAMSLLQDDVVHYNRQPIAVVIADTFEHAVAAAALVDARYATQAPILDFERARADAYAPKNVNGKPPDVHWGDWDAGQRAAEVRVDATFTTPMQSHNPMEPHATIAQWEGEHLTLYDATQYVSGVRDTVSKTLGMSSGNVRVVSPFVGGGFGCKGSAWSHVLLAAMCARQVGRPVRLVLDRPQMFGPVGGRPHTLQRVALGARRDGALTSIRHDLVANTSDFEDWTEPSAVVSRMMYACPNGATTHRLVKLNAGTPTFQRAPGEATGNFALEVAMDELAVALALDPIELRLKNYAEKEADSSKPFSSKHLRECYAQGAARFGWSRRSVLPRSMRDGTELVGFGMATASYPAHRMAASARAAMQPDGSFVVQSGSQDIGTGTYTVMTQVAAEALGVPPSRVRFELGDTQLPHAPVSGGSMTAASVGPAVQAACRQLRDKLVARAVSDGASPLHGASAADIIVDGGFVAVRDDPGRRETIAALAGRVDAPLEATAEAKPGDASERFALHSFGAVFAEVRVDPDLGVIRVPRVVAVYDIGRPLNVKTARSQMQGGIVWGMSFALLEDAEMDLRTGRIANANLAEYHVPVNADVGEIDVSFVDHPDYAFNPLGIRGIGEIGITGVPAALCNAIWHATGRRLRDLPMTLDKLL